jgi:hypothetical protein
MRPCKQQAYKRADLVADEVAPVGLPRPHQRLTREAFSFFISISLVRGPKIGYVGRVGGTLVRKIIRFC